MLGLLTNTSIFLRDELEMDKTLKNKSYRNTWVTGGLLLFLVTAGIYYLTTYTHSHGTLQISGNRISIDTVTKGIFKDELVLEGILKPLELEYIKFPEHAQIEKMFVLHGENVSPGDTVALVTFIKNDSIFKNHLVGKLIAGLREAGHSNMEEIQAQLKQSFHSISKKKLEAIKNDIAQTGKYNLPENSIAVLKANKISIPADFLKDLQNGIIKEYITAQTVGRIFIKKNTINNENNEEMLIISAETLFAEAIVDNSSLQRLQIDLKSKIVTQQDTFIAYTADIKAGEDKMYGCAQFRLSAPFTGYQYANQKVKIHTLLGRDENILLLPIGSFLQYTGGKWVYVVEGNKAEKREIQIGRRNIHFIEILHGLEKGEQVITSGYDAFYETDEFIIVHEDL